MSIANANMEDFEEQALATTPNPPQFWYHVDDTLTMLHMNLIEEFTNHINCLDPNIKFTIEEQDNHLSFLGTSESMTTPPLIKSTIYCKPTNIDQYLN